MPTRRIVPTRLSPAVENPSIPVFFMQIPFIWSFQLAAIGGSGFGPLRT
jgi:hypothetical protein